MKNKYLTLTFVLITVFVFACKNEVEPFADFKKKYVINCILDESSYVQSVTITHSFNEKEKVNDGVSHEVRNAKIKITDGINIYTFTEKKAKRLNTSLYQDSVICYTCSAFKPEQGKKYELIAELEDGAKLKSNTIIPTARLKKIFLDQLYLDDKKEFKFLYSYLNLPNITEYHVLPRLHFVYKYRQNGNFITKDVILPASKIVKDGKTKYLNHKMMIYPYAYYNTETLFDYFQELFAADTVKSNYELLGTKLEMFIMDKNLGRYYKTNESASEGVNILLDTYDYSNIEGGLGVFGSFVRNNDYIFLFPLFFSEKGFNTEKMNQNNF